MSQVCMLSLVGLPASGKTSLASLLARDKIGFDFVEHICFDELISWNNDSQDEVVWKEKRKSVNNYVENLILNFLNNYNKKKTLLVILDDNMYYCSMRYEFYRLAKKSNIKYCQIYLDTPKEICFERNNLRASKVPDSHIEIMASKIEKPSKQRHWEEFSVVIPLKQKLNDSLAQIKNLIVNCKIPEVLEKHQQDETTPQSSKHFADIALRKIVSRTIQNIKFSQVEDMKEKITEVIEIRRKILQSFDSDVSTPHFISVKEYIEYYQPNFSEIVGY